MTDSNPNQLTIESQTESSASIRTKTEDASASTDKQGGENPSTIYLLFEAEQFDKFEHWLRFGLIYPAHPVDADEHGKLKGIAEESGALPFAMQIIDFEILVEVQVTPQDLDLLRLCGNKSIVGWYSPGILPSSRIKSVLFQSFELLKSFQEQLKNGAVVPDVLNDYISKWAVIDEKDIILNESTALESLVDSKHTPEKIEVAGPLNQWEARYGQFSFLRALFMAMPELPITSNVINQFANAFGETWKELQELKNDIAHEISWQPKEFYDLFNVLEIVEGYAKGNDNASERIHSLVDRSDEFGHNLGLLIKEADCWWGVAMSENKPLSASFKAIQSWIEQTNLDGPTLTEVLIALTYNAMRLNLNKQRESSVRARSVNFTWQNNEVYMTSLSNDKMNIILAECCYALILKRTFDLDYWLAKTALSKQAIISLTTEKLTLFGMDFERVKHPNSLRLLIERMKSQKSEIHALREEQADSQDEIKKLQTQITELQERVSRTEELSTQIIQLATEQQKP